MQVTISSAANEVRQKFLQAGVQKVTENNCEVMIKGLKSGYDFAVKEVPVRLCEWKRFERKLREASFVKEEIENWLSDNKSTHERMQRRNREEIETTRRLFDNFIEDRSGNTLLQTAMKTFQEPDLEELDKVLTELTKLRDKLRKRRVQKSTKPKKDSGTEITDLEKNYQINTVISDDVKPNNTSKNDQKVYKDNPMSSDHIIIEKTPDQESVNRKRPLESLEQDDMTEKKLKTEDLKSIDLTNHLSWGLRPFFKITFSGRLTILIKGDASRIMKTKSYDQAIKELTKLKDGKTTKNWWKGLLSWVSQSDFEYFQDVNDLQIITESVQLQNEVPFIRDLIQLFAKDLKKLSIDLAGFVRAFPNPNYKIRREIVPFTEQYLSLIQGAILKVPHMEFLTINFSRHCFKDENIMVQFVRQIYLNLEELQRFTLICKSGDFEERFKNRINLFLAGAHYKMPNIRLGEEDESDYAEDDDDCNYGENEDWSELDESYCGLRKVYTHAGSAVNRESGYLARINYECLIYRNPSFVLMHKDLD